MLSRNTRGLILVRCKQISHNVVNRPRILNEKGRGGSDRGNNRPSRHTDLPLPPPYYGLRMVRGKCIFTTSGPRRALLYGP